MNAFHFNIQTNKNLRADNDDTKIESIIITDLISINYLQSNISVVCKIFALSKNRITGYSRTLISLTIINGIRMNRIIHLFNSGITLKRRENFLIIFIIKFLYHSII